MLSRFLNAVHTRASGVPLKGSAGSGASAGDTRARPIQANSKSGSMPKLERRLALPKPPRAGIRESDLSGTPMTNTAELGRLIDRHTRETRLADGTPIRVRPVLPRDKERLQSGLSRMSASSRYRRFMSPVGHLSPSLLRYLTEIDYDHHFALGALAIDHNPPLGAGVARYVCDPDQPHAAEPAVTVVDAYQGLALGKLLFEQLMDVARAHDITRFHALLLTDNDSMKRLFADQGADFSHKGHGELAAELSLL